MRPASRLALVLCFAASAAPARADWRDDIGATRFEATFSDVPDAADVLTQAEAGDTSGNTYLPDATNGAFAGQSIVNKSSGNGVSSHATVVGQYFYGAWYSLVPATPTIHAYNAGYWLEDDFLDYGTTNEPLIETARVQNHSWIATGDTLTTAQIEEIDRRLDYAINRDGFVCVAGVNNGNSTTLPKLLAQAYNLVTVGLSNGSHSAGFTAYDGAGRIKPDIVAPDFFTSYATPKVASAAAVLAVRARQSPHALAGPDVARVVKALLLAGATKEEFPAWARTTARPLDLRHGAGELNVLLSYRMLESGRAAASASTVGPDTGWATGNVAGGATRAWFFDVPAEAAAAPFSAALTWHRIVADGSPGPNWTPSAQALANLDLALYSASGFTLGAQLDLSASTVDNVEHIYAPALAPGRYALVVSAAAGAATTNYALAWRSTPTVTVAASVAEAREIDGAAGEFTLTRSGPTTTPLLVPITVGGSAVSGTHYAELPTSVLIPAGAASATVGVTPVADSLAQGDRTVTLAVAGDYSVAAGVPANASVTIRDKPYDAWRFTHFDAAQLADTAISGDMADTDGDGVPNLLEYALGGEPLTGDGAAISPALALAVDEATGATHLTLSYHQPAGRLDIGYVVEWSDDLTATWQNGASVIAETARVPTAGGERVTARAVAPLAGESRQFLRLTATRW